MFTLGGEFAGITAMTLKSGQALNFAVAVTEMNYLTPCNEFPVLAPEDSEPDSLTPAPPAGPRKPLPCEKPPASAHFSADFDQPYSLLPDMTITVTGWIENTGCQTIRDIEAKFELYRTDTGATVDIFSFRSVDYDTGREAKLHEGNIGLSRERRRHLRLQAGLDPILISRSGDRSVHSSVPR